MKQCAPLPPWVEVEPELTMTDPENHSEQLTMIVGQPNPVVMNWSLLVYNKIEMVMRAHSIISGGGGGAE